MAYVITQNCCKDASCVPVCPVDCIRPTSGDQRFDGTHMLFIDPASCIDCGACMDECPVGAIHYEDDLPVPLERYRDINAAYFDRHPLESDSTPVARKHPPVAPGTLRIAIVGAGPAACYAASELLDVGGVEVAMFERLPTPHGLIRAGVAPDHQHTKSVVDIFDRTFTSPELRIHFNVEIGRDLAHRDLLDHHHAVIYAVGAIHSRTLGIPGEHLPGSHPASDFVGWYNGHPDHVGHGFDLSASRAVVIGNGNVALDIARLLLMDSEQLAVTDTSEHALEALQHSRIEEVVIVARRGVRQAAFSPGEFLALTHLPGVDVVIDGDDDLDSADDDDVETALTLAIAREIAARPTNHGNKRAVFKFLATPVEIIGDAKVDGLRIVRRRDENGRTPDPGDSLETPEELATSLVLRSIGYAGAEIEGLPYDANRGVVPNECGRVIDENGCPVLGSYVAGWIKRGPRGVIGTNRTCAEETVTSLFSDFDDGVLDRDIGARADLEALMAQRGVESLDWTDWRAIDAAERARGAVGSRPRVKFVDSTSLLAAARSARSASGREQ